LHANFKHGIKVWTISGSFLAVIAEQDKPLPNAFRLRRMHQSTGLFMP
jgi:hypothetical protein